MDNKYIITLDVLLPENAQAEAGGLERALPLCEERARWINPLINVHYSRTCMFYRTPVLVTTSVDTKPKKGQVLSCDLRSPCGTKFRIRDVIDYTFDTAIDTILGEWLKLRSDQRWATQRIDSKYKILKKARDADPAAYEAWMEEKLKRANEPLPADQRYVFERKRVDYAGLDYIIRRSILKVISATKEETDINPKDVKDMCRVFYMEEERYYMRRDVGRIIEICGERRDKATMEKIGLRWTKFQDAALPKNWEKNYITAVDYLLENKDREFYEAWAKQQRAKKSQAKS